MRNYIVISIAAIVVVAALAIYFLYPRTGLPERAPLWRQEIVYGFDNFGTATYENGVLYAPSKAENKVYAINASDGSVIWERAVRQCDASPCIDGNVVYVGECSTPEGEQIPLPKAMALNKTTGEIIWSYIEPNSDEWVGSPLVEGDYVYYTTYGSGVYALNKTNGSRIWQREDVGTIICSVAYHGGVVFVSAYDPAGQYALNAITGDDIWHVNYGPSWDSSPVIYEGMVIQVTRNMSVKTWSAYVFNETNGELVRKFEEKGSPSTPLVYNGKILIPSYDTRIWAFNLSTGGELWHTRELSDGVSTGALSNPTLSYCSPVLTGGTVYFQSLSGTFYAINETDGGILWSCELGDYGFGSPSLGNNCVFITNDSALYAFNISQTYGSWPMFCQNKLHQSHKD